MNSGVENVWLSEESLEEPTWELLGEQLCCHFSTSGNKTWGQDGRQKHFPGG